MVNLLITVNNHTTKGYRTDNGEETRMNQDNTRLTKHKHVGGFPNMGVPKIGWFMMDSPSKSWLMQGGTPIYGTLHKHCDVFTNTVPSMFHKSETILSGVHEMNKRETTVQGYP